jgi:putative oxidoreductase
MRLGALVLRSLVGGLFVGHGTQKLFGWFGGYGPDATGQAFESMGLRPGKRHALAAGAAEAGGGVMLILGALTPIASALLSGTMVTAIRKVHADKGPWAAEGGYEYNAVLLAALFALTDNGPGPFSVDEAAFPRLRGPVLATLALGAGVAGSYLATEYFSEPAPEAEAPTPEAGEVPMPEPGGRFEQDETRVS